MDVTLHQERTAVADGFQVTNEITNATDITMHLFVLATGTGAYDRVATVHDIETYPETEDPELPFYRSTQGDKTFDNITDASEFGSYVKTRLDRVVQQYEVFKTAFEGSEDTVIPTP